VNEYTSLLSQHVVMNQRVQFTLWLCTSSNAFYNVIHVFAEREHIANIATKEFYRICWWYSVTFYHDLHSYQFALPLDCQVHRLWLTCPAYVQKELIGGEMVEMPLISNIRLLDLKLRQFRLACCWWNWQLITHSLISGIFWAYLYNLPWFQQCI